MMRKIFQIAIYLCFIVLQSCGGASSSHTAVDDEPPSVETPAVETSPVIIQLENWAFTGGSYGGFDRYSVSGGSAISFNQAGDYGEYKVSLSVGRYEVSIQAGTPVNETPTQVQLHLNNCLISTSDIHESGSWSEFLDNPMTEDLEVPTSGEYTLRVIGWGEPGTWQWNADYMTLFNKVLQTIINVGLV